MDVILGGSEIAELEFNLVGWLRTDFMSSLATNIKHFKQRLNDKERDLLAEITRLEGEALVSGEAEVRNSTDDATSSQGISESLQEGTLASQTLTQVHDALRRIEDGAYGKCAACGRQIEAARLEAIPWAPYCLEDQEKQEADMLTRTVDSPFHLEERVHESHQKAAEQHELAARALRTAAEHNEKGDNPAGNWHSERALEYAEHAYRLAKDAHNKSGQIGGL